MDEYWGFVLFITDFNNLCNDLRAYDACPHDNLKANYYNFPRWGINNHGEWLVKVTREHMAQSYCIVISLWF